MRCRKEVKMTQPLENGPKKVLARNDAREALIAATLAVISSDGSASFQPNEICRELGLSRSLVNFHFGGREGLIAEAMAVGYEQYVAELRCAAESAGDDPVACLLAWVDRQIEWTIDNPGLAAVLNFQREASGIRSEFHPSVTARLEAAGTGNFALLVELVGAARSSRGIDSSSNAVGLNSAIVGWLTLGLSVWLAGRHGPTQSLNRPELVELARQQVRQVIADMVLS
jgi:AcrR family transcriptional regulator